MTIKKDVGEFQNEIYILKLKVLALEYPGFCGINF